MADVSNERGVSETMDLVDATGHKLNQATQQGVFRHNRSRASNGTQTESGS